MTRAALTTFAFICAATPAQAQYLSSEDLARRTIERRAVEAVIWGMPVVNYDLMLQEMLSKTNGKVNQVIYWGRPLDWKNQTLTPNPDARRGSRNQILRPVRYQRAVPANVAACMISTVESSMRCSPGSRRRGTGQLQG